VCYSWPAPTSAGVAGYAFLPWRSQSETRLPVIKLVVIARAKGQSYRNSLLHPDSKKNQDMSKRVIAVTATFHTLNAEVFAASCSIRAFPLVIETRLLGTFVAHCGVASAKEMSAEQFGL